MLLENSIHSGTEEEAQEPVGLLRMQGASQPSPFDMAQTQPPPFNQKARVISFMLLLLGGQTGLQGGRAYLREGGFFPGMLC